MEKKIVIIGAGYGGILTAKKLAKRFKKYQNINITIIDKNPYHTMLTELHEVAANRVDDDSIKISLKKVFAGRRVNVIHDIVNKIDYDKKVVFTSLGEYNYDYLVLAAGSKPTFYGIEGAEENAFRLWSYEDAIILREHIHEMFRKAAVETNLEQKKKLLSFYVVGAGFTGVEMVGELAEYVPYLCKKFDLDRDLVSIYNVDILSRTVSNLPEKLSKKVEKRLSKMGVKFKLNTNVVAIGKDYIETSANGKSSRYNTNTVIWAAGIQSSDITRKAAEVMQSTNSGRIMVDKYLRSVDNESVYVIGDNMYFVPEGEEKPVPQMVENCEQSSDVAAKNIYAQVSGKGNLIEYKPTFHGVMVSVGSRYGVARVGTPKMMFNLPSFLAMFVKHFINMVYFAQVAGWNKVFSYMKHEFFTIRNQRSFVGGHFSNRTPSFLLVPLRVWLGLVWLYEGIAKVFDKWLVEPKLEGFFGGANSWYNSILQAAGQAVALDAATSATAEATTQATGEAAAAAGVLIFNWNILGIFKAIFVSGKELASSAIGDFAFKLDVPLINWFIDTLIMPQDTVQVVMQSFIVIAEILIGLALIGGLFTTIAAGGSLILQFMFVTTTGLYLSTFWMIFAGVAVLIGAGRTFGLDYYFMPHIKRLWQKIPFIRKLYIYND